MERPVGPARVAVVTGASRGIGAATARHLAATGCTTVLAARTAEALDTVAADIVAIGGRAAVVPTDLTHVPDLDALVSSTLERFGRLDILVNNAGVLPAATRAERLTTGDWQRCFDLNVTAPWYLACRAKDAMHSGVIVNITSTAAFYPSIGFAAYNASKAALSMLTHTLALEWARDGVRVLGVAPGKVDTGMVEPIVAYSDRHGMRLNPLGRLGRPEEVARLIGYLVSDDAAYMTGSIVTIDGGEVLAAGGQAS